MNASLGTDTLPTWRMRFLPSFCFSKQLLLAGDVAAVALGQHVLAQRLDRLAGDDLAADGRLNGNFKQLAGDGVLELFGDGAPAGVGAVAVDDDGERVALLAV